jgi:hypothetical protein
MVDLLQLWSTLGKRIFNLTNYDLRYITEKIALAQSPDDHREMGAFICQSSRPHAWAHIDAKKTVSQ